MASDYTVKDFQADFKKFGDLWAHVQELGLEMEEDDFYVKRLARISSEWKAGRLSEEKAFNFLKPVFREGIPSFEYRINKYMKKNGN